MPNRHNLELFGIGLLIFSLQICYNKKVLQKALLKTNKCLILKIRNYEKNVI
jgi:hypothetical protein